MKIFHVKILSDYLCFTANIKGAKGSAVKLVVSLSSTSFSSNWCISSFNFAITVSLCPASKRPGGLVVRPNIRPE